MTVYPIQPPTPAEEAMLDAWWAQQPQRPAAPQPMAIPFGAAKCTIVCRACGGRDDIAAHWPGKLCCLCRADLPATRAYVEEQIETLQAQFDEALAVWADVLAGMDADTTRRWDALSEARMRAEAAVEHAARRNLRSRETVADAAQQQTEAQAALDAILSKVERTKTQESNPLRPVLLAEDAHKARMRDLEEQRQRWAVAIDHIAAIEEGNTQL